MKLSKANKRDKKSFKGQHGMHTSGKSVFLIQQVIAKRAKKIKGQK